MTMTKEGRMRLVGCLQGSMSDLKEAIQYLKYCVENINSTELVGGQTYLYGNLPYAKEKIRQSLEQLNGLIHKKD